MHRRFSFDRKTGAGIELYRNTPPYVTVSGLQVGKCEALPPIDGILDRCLLKESFGQLWSYEREGWARRFFEVAGPCRHLDRGVFESALHELPGHRDSGPVTTSLLSLRRCFKHAPRAMQT